MELLESYFKQQIIIRSIPISTAVITLMEGTSAGKPHCILVDGPSAPNWIQKTPLHRIEPRSPV